jgi:hypothetical protein
MVFCTSLRLDRATVREEPLKVFQNYYSSCYWMFILSYRFIRDTAERLLPLYFKGRIDSPDLTGSEVISIDRSFFKDVLAGSSLTFFMCNPVTGIRYSALYTLKGRKEQFY